MSKDQKDDKEQTSLIDRENISYMKAPITNKTPSYVVSLDQIKEAMSDPEIYKDRTLKYRELKQEFEETNIKDLKHKASEVKQGEFDYVTFSGHFKYVSNNSLITHSGLICIDIDKLGDESDVQEVKKTLLEDDNIDTTMLFVSPSGNGIKWVVAIDIDEDNPHSSQKDYFMAIDAYMKQAYNIEIDQACKDVARACYLPYDPDVILKESPTELTQDFVDMWKPEEAAPNVFKKSKTVTSGGKLTPWDDYNKNGDMQELLTKHGWSYVGSGPKGDEYLRPGNSTNRYSAIHFKDTNILYVHSDSTELDLGDNTPAKVFCELEANGDWSKASKLLKEAGYGEQQTINIVDRSTNKRPSEDAPSTDVYAFWEVNKKGNCTIHQQTYIHFLEEELDYAQVDVHGATKIVKLKGRIMHESKIEDIIQDTRQYIEQKIDEPLSTKVAEAFIKQILGKISRKILTTYLRSIKYDQQEETHDNAYFYYSDKMVEVKEDEVIVKDYTDLDGYIWADQRLEREWQGIADFDGFNYFKFLQNITGHSKKRWDSLRSVIGYLLHSNKTEGNAKAIIFVDQFSPSKDINASNGGTGKSIVGKSLAHMKKQCYVDGKHFKPGKNNFALSNVKPGDQTLFIDDIKKGFNFEDLYVMVTSDMEIEKKYENKVKIPFEDSPKLVIASNKALKSDDGESDERRQVMVEFAPHYNAEFTPMDEFDGEVFFDKYKWDREDWKKFDSLMIHCLQYYFSIDNQMKEVEITYKFRKLLERIGPEVYEFCENNIKLGKFYTTEALYNGDMTSGFGINEGFVQAYDGYDIYKSEFAKRLKVWAEYKGYNARKERGSGDHRGKRGWVFKQK